MKKRTAKVRRQTKETNITVEVDLDGKGAYGVSTGLPFLDHMLELLSRHSLIDLKIRASGDLDVDFHHTVEDVGLALGKALDKALGARAGIRRYGCSLTPMDEALSRVAENFKTIKEQSGPDAIGVLSSARITNEENYLVQKFTRAVIGTNNVDHCARL